MPVCPGCQTEVAGGVTFCQECGARIAAPHSPADAAARTVELDSQVTIPAARGDAPAPRDAGTRILEPNRPSDAASGNETIIIRPDTPAREPASGNETIVVRPDALQPAQDMPREHDATRIVPPSGAPPSRGATTPPAGTPTDAPTSALPAPPAGPATTPPAGTSVPDTPTAALPTPAPGPEELAPLRWPAGAPPPPSGGRRLWVIAALLLGLVVGAVITGVLGVLLLTRSAGPAARPTILANVTPRPTATPRPTSTPRPTAVPQPTAMADSFGPVVLKDTLENPRRSTLNAGETEEATYAFQDDAYVITLKRPKYIVWSPFGDTYDDASVEIDTVILDGPRDSASGVLFRYQDDKNFYMFSVTGDGRYSLDRYYQDELTTLIDWTESPAIKAAGEPNRLRIETQANRIRLFVNDQLLDEISDDTFLSGGMALAVSTFEEGNVMVQFDNLVVREADT